MKAQCAFIHQIYVPVSHLLWPQAGSPASIIAVLDFVNPVFLKPGIEASQLLKF